jgi:hypothetical protein
MEWLLVVLLSAFAIIYIISMINRFTAFDCPVRVQYVYPDQMNNGDLLCISYDNMSTDFISSFTNSVWVHVGMVWVDPDTNLRYVLEGAIYSGKHYKHFFAIPVETWMNINRKNIIAWRRYSGPELDSTQMMHEFFPFIKFSKLEGFNLHWNRFLINKKYREPDRLAYYTCFEAIVIIGQQLGIFSKEKYYTSYFPNHLVNGGIELCKGVSYSDKIEVRMTDYYRNLLLLDMEEFGAFWGK